MLTEISGMVTVARGPGRPRKEDGGHRYFETDLHGVLVKGLPEHFVHIGRIDIGRLAEALDYSRATVGRRIHDNSISTRLMHGLVAIEGTTITKNDLLPFLS